MTLKLLVYDLDGTLFETLPDLVSGVARAFAEKGWSSPKAPEVRRAIGDGARALLERLVPAGTSVSEVDDVVERFRRRYLEACCERTSLLPGAASFLKARFEENHPPRQALLTNKPQDPTDRLVRHFRLDSWLGKAIGGDTVLGRKPNPAGLLHLLDWADATPAEALFIGDGPADALVAKAVGMPIALLTEGYGHREELEGVEAQWRVRSLLELSQKWPEISAHWN